MKLTPKQKQALQILKEKPRLLFKPNRFQQRLCMSTKKTVVAVAANRIGKTYGMAYAITCHLLGKYPKWWEGPKFSHAPNLLLLGVDGDQLRKGIQKHLVGDVYEGKVQTGNLIHPTEIVGTSPWSGVKGGITELRVKHSTGDTSAMAISSYRAGVGTIMGMERDFVGIDEEPPEEIYTQALTRLLTGNKKKGGYMMAVYTPENGYTRLTIQMLESPSDNVDVIRGTWEDAEHLDEEAKADLLSKLPERERAMRSEGIPLAGAGVVYPVMQKEYVIEPIEVPAHWKQVIGIDFGWNHPTTAIKVAYDTENEMYYVVGEYGASKTPVPVHASAIKRLGEGLNVVWPADGASERNSGETLKRQFHNEGIKMTEKHFTNPDTFSKNVSNRSVEAGLEHIRTLFSQKRIKVFNTCTSLIREISIYRYDRNNKIVKEQDDYVDAFRYALLSVGRYGRTEGSANQAVAGYDLREWEESVPDLAACW